MIKTKLLIAAAIVAIGFTACNTGTKTKDVETLTMYVDSVDNMTPVYTTENWTMIENGYQARVMETEKNMATYSAEEKARADASKAKYEALKAKYEMNIKEAEAKAAMATTTPNYRQVLRNRLFGEGKIGDDMKFEFVTAANLLSVYKNFGKTVSDNRES
mgnify:CR=1 FL=1